MITIATYRHLTSAELAKARLELYDIPAVIADACFYILGYGSILDGVRLQVPEADAERAKEILATEASVDLPDESTIMAESPAAEAPGGEAPQEAATAFDRFRGWILWLLFLAGCLCLIVGRPADDWITPPSISGQFILLGVLLIAAGLWISYGRLSSSEDHEPAATAKTNGTD